VQLQGTLLPIGKNLFERWRSIRPSSECPEPEQIIQRGYPSLRVDSTARKNDNG